MNYQRNKAVIMPLDPNKIYTAIFIKVVDRMGLIRSLRMQALI